MKNLTQLFVISILSYFYAFIALLQFQILSNPVLLNSIFVQYSIFLYRILIFPLLKCQFLSKCSIPPCVSLLSSLSSLFSSPNFLSISFSLPPYSSLPITEAHVLHTHSRSLFSGGQAFWGEALTPHRIYTVFRISTLGHFADQDISRATQPPRRNETAATLDSLKRPFLLRAHTRRSPLPFRFT